MPKLGYICTSTKEKEKKKKKFTSQSWMSNPDKNWIFLLIYLSFSTNYTLGQEDFQLKFFTGLMPRWDE